MSDKVIKVPKMSTEITIPNEWIMGREALLGESSHIKSVESQDNYEKAEILLKKIGIHGKELDKHRAKFVKPFNDFVKEINAFSKEHVSQLESAKERIKGLLVSFIDEQEKKKQLEIEEKTAGIEEDPFAEFKTIEIETKGVRKIMSSTRLVWKYEITNEVDVPREFCSPDDKKIAEHLKTNQDAANIPGVRFYQERTVQSR